MLIILNYLDEHNVILRVLIQEREESQKVMWQQKHRGQGGEHAALLALKMEEETDHEPKECKHPVEAGKAKEQILP